MKTPPFSHICDRCGCPIESDELRYIVEIQVYAAPTPIRIDEEDLRNPDSALAETIEQCEGRSEQELMDEVHKQFKLDLCRRCQKQYILDPIPQIDP